MDAVEKAIRNALAKGDAADRAFRERVYRSVYAALERALAANPDLGEDVVALRRQRMKATITEVEREFVPAAPAIDPPISEEPVSAPPDPVEPPLSPPEPESHEPELRTARPPTDAASDNPLRAMRDDPAFEGGAFPAGTERDRLIEEPEDKVHAEPGDPRPRRRWIAVTLIVATLLAALGIFYWFAAQTGLFLTADQRDTSVRSPPLALEEESFAPGAPQSAPQPGAPAAPVEHAWITVFSPDDPTTVEVAADAEAEARVEEGERVLRLRTGASGTPIVFNVGRGILENLAGRQAVFAISARPIDDEQTQMSLSCDFGALGDCGRRRYAVAGQRTDYLFEVVFPEASPDAPGRIAIVTDFEGQGRGIDIFSIRAHGE